MKLTLASKITIIRVALIPLLVLLMYLPGQVAAIAAIILFIVASLSDFVDGYIARKYNQISTFGMFLDPLADKFLVISVMLVLVERGIFPGWAAFAVIARELAVTSLRLFAVEKDRVIAAANSGKLKTAFTMPALVIMMLPVLLPTWLITALWVIILILTLYSGWEYFFKNMDVFKD
jgi:CDP-diacylglycerol--glycerol-3-phosphate 3-phosphatidyltransferase